jgi:transglutaminase-like putative cysteine protease
MKKVMIFIAGLCFIVICAIKIYVINNTASSDFFLRKYSIPRQVQYQFTLQNKSNRLLKQTEFITHAPVKLTATQHCSRIQSSHPYKLTTDALGNQILNFTFDEFLPYATRIVTVTADLLISNRTNPLPEQELQIFLVPEKYIEADASEIYGLAKKLKASTPLKTAERIFRWVADNVQYVGYLRNDRGALYAFRHRQGDCTEFMYLFAALCRANQIPARCMGGYICWKNSILKPANYHNWAEFFDGKRWQIADPQKKNFMQHEQDYIAMQILHTTPNASIEPFKRFKVDRKEVKVKMI